MQSFFGGCAWGRPHNIRALRLPKSVTHSRRLSTSLGPWAGGVAPIALMSQAAVKSLEELLKSSIYSKTKKGNNEERTLKEAFKTFDLDNSGEVSYDEVRGDGNLMTVL